MLKKWLRRWLGVPDATYKAEVLPPRGGFFTTDSARGIDSDDPAAMRQFLGIQVRRNFQRTDADLCVVGQPTLDPLNRPVVAAMDDWSGLGESAKNIFTLDGCGIPSVLADWYGAQGFIGYQMCAVLAQHWMVDKACTMPARDATRVGYKITVNDGTPVGPDVLDFMKKLDEKFQLSLNGREFVRHCRIYGIRIALFEVTSEDPDYYLKPFNPDGVMPGSYKGISQVDPYWITPELDMQAAADPASKHFYEPTYWRINGKRYHRTHLVIIKTCDVPDVLKPTYFYGGIPLPQRIYERVYAAERTANEAPQLALTKRSTVIHVDLDAAVANEAKFTERLAKWVSFLNNFGVKVLGKDETAEQFDTSLNDLDETIMTQYQIVAAIAEVPATKLLGTVPKGFNSTGSYEESSYHELLESILTHDVQPLYERHHLLCVRSYVMPKFNIPAFGTTVVFDKLDAETSKEASDRRLADSEAAKNYADTGAIDGTDIREKLIADDDSGYNGIPVDQPEGPRPAAVVTPGATKAAPNDPTPAETAAKPSGGSGGFGQ